MLSQSKHQLVQRQRRSLHRRISMFCSTDMESHSSSVTLRWCSTPLSSQRILASMVLEVPLAMKAQGSTLRSRSGDHFLRGRPRRGEAPLKMWCALRWREARTTRASETEEGPHHCQKRNWFGSQSLWSMANRCWRFPSGRRHKQIDTGGSPRHSLIDCAREVELTASRDAHHSISNSCVLLHHDVVV